MIKTKKDQLGKNFEKIYYCIIESFINFLGFPFFTSSRRNNARLTMEIPKQIPKTTFRIMEWSPALIRIK